MDVSIIIPVYNAEEYIEDCLQSVEKQTFNGSMECIIIDDCGIDHSVKRIQQFINHGTAVNYRLLRQQSNQGPSAARNRGIREATGDYVFFLDADDTITPYCIEALYSHAVANRLDYVQGIYDGEKRPPVKSVILDRKEIKRTLLDFNVIPFTPHNKLLKRKMLTDHSLYFNEEIKVREDFLWMSFVAKYVVRMGHCNETTYKRGYNEKSLTHDIDLEREIKGYRVLIETMCENLDPFLVGEQKKLILEALIMCLNSGYYHDEKEKSHLISVIRNRNNILENSLLHLYLSMPDGRLRNKILHILIRLYKTENK